MSNGPRIALLASVSSLFIFGGILASGVYAIRGLATTPMVGANVDLVLTQQCFVYQCSTYGSSVPTTFSGVTDASGYVSFTMTSYTTGTGISNPNLGNCQLTIGPSFIVFVLAPGAITPEDFILPGPILTNSCPTGVNTYPESVTYTMSNGQTVRVTMNAPTTTTTTTTSTSTTTTTSTTGGTPISLPTLSISQYVGISLLGMGSIIIIARRNELGE